MSRMTFLTEYEALGDNKLEILKKYGSKAAITDFSILLGGAVNGCYCTSEGNTLDNRAGWWFTRSPVPKYVVNVDPSGGYSWSYATRRYVGARPTLPYSLIKSISSNGVRGASGVKEIEYGEYPQTVVNEKYSNLLEKAYEIGVLTTTGYSYTTDSFKYANDNSSFQPRTHIEYEYKGRKYIRFEGDHNCTGFCSDYSLSDGRMVENGNVYWVKVEPIIWLVDEQEDIVLSKKIIFAGVQFKNSENYNGVFDATDIKRFMDKYFVKDIIVKKNHHDMDTAVDFIQGLNELKRYFVYDKIMLAKIDILINAAEQKERKIKKLTLDVSEQNKVLKKIKQLTSDDTIK